MSHHMVIVVGNLGSDPELRTASNGQKVCNLSVASNRKYTDKNGELQQETTWFRCAAWGALAEPAAQHLSKGRQVYIEGRLVSDSYGNPRVWSTQAGQPAASFELTIQTLRFLGSPANTGAPEPKAPPELEDNLPE